MSISSTAEKAELLRSLHVPGDPLIVTNVWDSITARIVAGAPGVKALATASHSISEAHGVEDGEGLDVDDMLAAVRLVIRSVDLPVSVDFEKAYATDAAGTLDNVFRLIEEGAAGLNIEDSIGQAKAPLYDIDAQVSKIAAARRAGDRAGVPIVINARVDSLAGDPDSFDDAITRANAYLDAGADCAFVLGLGTEDLVKAALDRIHGKVSVISNPSSVPLARLAELGVSRVSFGPTTMGLTLSHLRDAATTLTARGDYPAELGFAF
ncbi:MULTISPECIES: isocitrate lyase/phosphoenolpyruvate mutase family protein [unclassified Frigoribacterium]|uniref:isocitrate lyase/PEP mutase family protein n=1 Tax=unclassified Frigoribacterium TaxID=2627005 RepID=UPI0006F31979|nr:MULTISPECIES: isocitrate lyase/phosphoenolpyruvate mutase family protein [unclassified Frigoribacterium]KQO45101.1 PEP phosphonomutase [Frigoribacterium sp. Leaf254]KQT40585.1 PEP phosphonomutase [Frigoribacterium sp. Leaf415]